MVKIVIQNKTIKVSNGKIEQQFILPAKFTKSQYKTLLSNLKNISFGGANSYTLRLILLGVGYRVEDVSNNTIKLKIGFSHFVFIKVPDLVSVFATKRNQLVLKSANLELLTQFAAKIKGLKLPDPYKGKGIRFKNEILVLKEGKKK